MRCQRCGWEVGHTIWCQELTAQGFRAGVGRLLMVETAPGPGGVPGDPSSAPGGTDGTLEDRVWALIHWLRTADRGDEYDSEAVADLIEERVFRTPQPLAAPSAEVGALIQQEVNRRVRAAFAAQELSLRMRLRDAGIDPDDRSDGWEDRARAALGV